MIGAAQERSDGDLALAEQDQIQAFWESYIGSFKISHGTSGVYHKHFQRHGISATYPKALESLVTSIRKVWSDHEGDIAAKTEYFRWFEERYDMASKKKQITMSFSAGSSMDEFTTGERGYGGEWVRELQTFLNKAKAKKERLNPDEQEVLLNTEALIDVMRKVPPMTVNVSFASLKWGSHDGSLFCPLEKFRTYVKKECTQSSNPRILATFLASLLPQIEEEKARIQSNYEICVHEEVPPEQLTFEFIKDSFSSAADTSNYPKLEFNQPTELSLGEVIALGINPKTKRSAVEAYKDSIFEYEYPSNSNPWIVTRLKSTGVDRLTTLCNGWIAAFECEHLL